MTIYTRETAHKVFWLGDWVGPRTGLDLVPKKETNGCVGNQRIQPLLPNPYSLTLLDGMSEIVTNFIV
jgi:hypothetical protein